MANGMLNTDPALIRTGRGLHAAGAAMTLLLAVGPYVVAGLPMSAQNASLRRQIDRTTRLLALEPNVRSRYETLTREADAHERRRREVLERIPEAAEEGEFLAQVAALAGQCELKLQNYRPGPSEKRPGYSQMDVSLDADGSYEEVCRFLAGLEALPRYCRLAGLTVDRTAAESDSLKIAITLRIFFATTPVAPTP
jgi:Tfp pilus assembly protein PilO